MERLVGQTAHLGMGTLLAGVFPECVRESDYLLKRSHYTSVESAITGVADSQPDVWFLTPQLTRPTHRAEEAVRTGCSAR